MKTSETRVDERKKAFIIIFNIGDNGGEPNINSNEVEFWWLIKAYLR